MPDYFSHRIFAERVYERLGGDTRKKIDSETLYLVGAQGGDAFFMYNLTLSDKNIGRKLHRMDAAQLFSCLCLGNFSYAAGFATHYALDSTLHPTVYAFVDGHKGLFVHQKFEEDLGLFISRYYGERRLILPRERLLACTGTVYDSVRSIEPSITMTGVERSLKRFFTYSRKLYNKKRSTYRYDYDYSSLADKLGEATDVAVSAIECVKERQIDPGLFSKEFL